MPRRTAVKTVDVPRRDILRLVSRTIDIGEYLMLAEYRLGLPVDALRDQPGVVTRVLSALARPEVAWAGIPLYPRIADRAAALVVGLVHEQPLPHGNVEVAYLAMKLQ